MSGLPTAPVAFTVQHLLWSGLDLLFPPHCAGCGAQGWRWCPECAASVQNPVEPLCEICGTSLPSDTLLCADCRRRRPAYRALRSWSVFDGPIRKALHRLKYRRDLGLGEALVPQLAAFLADLGWQADVLVPVPLSRKRLAERGYNQVSLIARPLAHAMRIDYAPDAVRRVHDTRSQVGLSRAERQANVQNAFHADGRRLSGCKVLLMDDTATTGSTLSSCAEALCVAGAWDVFAYTVARAMPHHGLHTV